MLKKTLASDYNVDAKPKKPADMLNNMLKQNNMLKRKTSLTKRDSTREFTGFCGKSVTYKIMLKHTPQFTGGARNLGHKSKMSELFSAK